MTEQATEIDNGNEASLNKFKPGLSLAILYDAFHTADRSAKSAQSAYKEAELEQRRRLVPACLQLLSEWEAATHGQTMEVYKRAKLTAPAAAQHMDLARVYRLIDDETLAALDRDGTLLSVNQGVAIATAFELRKKFSLDQENSNRHIAEFAAECARLGTAPKEIKEQLRLYAETLEEKVIESQVGEAKGASSGTNTTLVMPTSATGAGADSKTGGIDDSGPESDTALPIELKSEPRPIERPHQCPRYVVVGTSFAEMKAAVVRLMNKESEFERYCKDGLALIAVSPSSDLSETVFRSGKASSVSETMGISSSTAKFDPDPFQSVKMEA